MTNPFHKTVAFADGAWNCTCGISGVEDSEGLAHTARLRHAAFACRHCTQPFGACQPDCPSDSEGIQWKVHEDAKPTGVWNEATGRYDEMKDA